MGRIKTEKMHPWITVEILRSDEYEKLPKYSTDTSSGADIYSIERAIIKPGETRMIKTGIKMKIPVGLEVQIRPRSGLAKKHSIMITNSPGTIDADYRGEIGILLYNGGSEEFNVFKGDRIAQMVLCPVYQMKFKEVDELEDTERNDGGFGHSGVK